MKPTSSQLAYCRRVKAKRHCPAGIYLSQVSKIALEQCPSGHCSNVILLTLDR